MDRVQHKEIEGWFIGRGVPHFIVDYSARTDIWTRAIPLLILAYLAGGLNALNLADWSAGRNIVAGGVTIAVLVLGWAITNLVLRRPFWSIPTEVGRPELAAFVIGPVVPSAIFGQWGDAAQALIEGVVILGAIYLLAAFAVGQLIAWAIRASLKQVRMLGRLLVRALPQLLLFTVFLFINAEVWQVAGTLFGLPYFIGLVIFFILGAVFVLSGIPKMLDDLDDFSSSEEIARLIVDTPADGLPVPDIHERPLGRGEKLDLILVSTFNQAVQVTFVAIVLTAFFVTFGFIAIPLDTQIGWMSADTTNVFFTLTISGRELVMTESLIRVAGFLGAFIGMYFTVVLSTDNKYKEDFAEDTAPEIHKSLAVRLVYRHAHAQLTTPDNHS
ncbi:MAG: hypothetical protein EB147_08000 [Acidimicrobiia bacterium]|nr:hypothetical protein [Actinomycetota bacterium]NDD96365.1 hypothetical protein [Actinomycetota bacterium]NDE81116.1 hypothetical protein [Actinomycetota bacterium]NDF32156.1 hypothetical protein [Acidimicrobiia bacterium]